MVDEVTFDVIDEVKFIYRHSEFDPMNEDLGVNNVKESETFEGSFQVINSKYRWFELHLKTVHEDY